MHVPVRACRSGSIGQSNESQPVGCRDLPNNAGSSGVRAVMESFAIDDDMEEWEEQEQGDYGAGRRQQAPETSVDTEGLLTRLLESSPYRQARTRGCSCPHRGQAACGIRPKRGGRRSPPSVSRSWHLVLQAKMPSGMRRKDAPSPAGAASPAARPAPAARTPPSASAPAAGRGRSPLSAAQRTPAKSPAAAGTPGSAGGAGRGRSAIRSPAPAK